MSVVSSRIEKLGKVMIFIKFRSNASKYINKWNHENSLDLW